LGTNFLGTEHLLIGALIADGAAARALGSLGLTVEWAEGPTRAEFAPIQARRRS
jgi:hypothetical protein